MNLSNSLIDKILTRRDAVETADKLGTVISRSFEKDQTIEGLLKNYFDKDTLNAILETIKNSGEKTASEAESLSQVKSIIETLPNLRLTIAVRPTVRMVESLSRTVRKIVNPNLTLEFDVDPTIIGGAVVVNNGKVFDHTVKRKVQEFFEKNQEKIITKIHND